MSRRRGGVRGPNSALTEFLRTRGIYVDNQSQRQRARAAAENGETDAGVRAQDEAPLSAEAETVALTAEPEDAVLSAVADEGGSSLNQASAKFEGDATPGSETPAAEPSPKRVPKSRSRKKKVELSDDDDNDYQPDENDRANFSYAKRPQAGSMTICTNCTCRFTVTIYSKAAEDGPGLLCHRCSNELKAPKQAAAPKRKPIKRRKAEKAAKLDGTEYRMPKLADQCIKLIAKHIDDVEALGDIGQLNMDKICRILSKNRSLNSQTISLFLDSSATSLAFHDCSRINDEALYRIAQFCPHLESVNLQFCGNITDNTIQFFATHLKNLKHVSFGGAFLVTVQAWKQFFETVGKRLETFDISDTSRFKSETANWLVENCPNLSTLRLHRITYLDDECVRLFAGLRNLRRIEISYPGNELTTPPLIDLVNTIGTGLEQINLDGNPLVIDDLLKDAIRNCCGRLKELSIYECESISDDGIQALFDRWDTNRGLTSLNVGRCYNLTDVGLRAAMQHSGRTLVHLNINSLNNITKDALADLAGEKNDRLETLDAGFVRDIDDEIAQALSHSFSVLSKFLIWGNNHVTQFCRPRQGVGLIGREADIF